MQHMTRMIHTVLFPQRIYLRYFFLVYSSNADVWDYRDSCL